MPIYEFQSPDGRTIEIEGETEPPIGVVQRLYAQRMAEAQQPPAALPQPPPAPSTPSGRSALPPEAVITPSRLGYYEHEYVPGEMPITSEEGFRRAAMTTKEKVAEKAGGQTIIDIGEDAIREEESKASIMRATEENVLERGGRDIAEIVKGIGSIVGLADAPGTVQTEEYSQAAPSLQGGRDPSTLAAVVGGVGGWYASLLAHPLDTLRYNPVEGALELIGPLTGAVRYLKSIGKVDEAAHVAKVAEGATEIGRARVAREGADVTPEAPSPPAPVHGPEPVPKTPSTPMTKAEFESENPQGYGEGTEGGAWFGWDRYEPKTMETLGDRGTTGMLALRGRGTGGLSKKYDEYLKGFGKADPAGGPTTPAHTAEMGGPVELSYGKPRASRYDDLGGDAITVLHRAGITASSADQYKFRRFDVISDGWATGTVVEVRAGPKRMYYGIPDRDAEGVVSSVLGGLPGAKERAAAGRLMGDALWGFKLTVTGRNSLAKAKSGVRARLDKALRERLAEAKPLTKADTPPEAPPVVDPPTKMDAPAVQGPEVAPQQYSGQPIKSLRHADLEEAYPHLKESNTAAPDYEALKSEARSSGLASKEGAGATAKKVAEGEHAGSLVEMAGVMARMDEVGPALSNLHRGMKQIDNPPREMVAQLAELNLEFQQLAEAAHRGGTTGSQRLNFQKAALGEDTSLYGLARRAKKTKGSKLTSEEMAALAEEAEEFGKLKAKLDDLKKSVADRLGVKVSRMKDDGAGIPARATSAEVDEFQRLHAGLVQRGDIVHRYINRLDPKYMPTARGWVERNFPALVTLPKMIMAGADLSAPLRQGLIGHLMAPKAMWKGWRAMFKSAKPSKIGDGLVDHPWDAGKRITSEKYAELSQREAVTGIKPGMSSTQIEHANEVTKTVKAMGVDLTAIGSKADAVYQYQGKKARSYAGALSQGEETLMSSFLDPWTDIAKYETPAGTNPSWLRSKAMQGAAKLAKGLQAYGEFSERTFNIGLNHMRRDSVKVMLGLDDMTSAEIRAFRKMHKARDPEGLKTIGKGINTMFGRGDLHNLDRAKFWYQLANALMFSPRYAISRFQVLTKPAQIAIKKTWALRNASSKPMDIFDLPKLTAEAMAKALPYRGRGAEKALKSKWRSADYMEDADAILFKESMAAAARLIAMVGAANVAGQAFYGKDFFNTSPEAGSDWFKLKLPGTDTRLDVFGGMTGPVRFLYTMTTGDKYSLGGKHSELDVDFGSTRANTAWTYFRGKASPFASAAYDQILDKDFKGDPASIATSIKGMSMPIILQDMMESGLLPVGEKDLSPESLAVLPAIFGVGYTNFPMRGGVPKK